MPVTAFAILHVTVYSKTLLNVILFNFLISCKLENLILIFFWFKLLGGPDSFKPIRKLINFVISKDKDMMRFIAVNEIILAPTIVVLIFT